MLAINSRSLFLLDISASIKIRSGDKSAEIVMNCKTLNPDVVVVVESFMRESYPNRSSMQALLKKAEFQVTPPLNYATSGISPLIR